MKGGEDMFRTMKYHYKCKNENEKKLLMFLFHISKNLYNAALYTLRQLYFNKENICSYFELNKKLNSNENFHILNTYASICTIRQAYKSMYLFYKKHNELPRYLSKKDVYAIYTDQVRPIIYKNKNYIKLPLSNLMRTNRIFNTEFNDSLIKEFIKDLNINNIENIYFPIPNVIKDKQIKQVRIVPKYKGEYIEIEFTYIKYKKESIKESNDTNVLGIDIGINNLMTLVSTTNNSYIIDGKRLKSINQFYNKQKAYYQSKLFNNEYSKRLRRLDMKNKNRVEDYINKAVNKVISITREEKVNKIVIGYNKGLKQKGIKNEVLTNKEKAKINQSFISIPLSRMINKIKNKCEEQNIDCIIINESYTSMSSFYDNDKLEKQENYSGKRIKRGLYLRNNSIEVNADINAALNIIRKSKPNDNGINYLRDRGLTIPKRLQVVL